MAAPSIDQFAKVLSKGPDWYSLGVYLGVPYHELNAIKHECSGISVTRCLIEVYQCLVKLGKAPSWNSIASKLRSMDHHALAEHIESAYIPPSLEPLSESSSSNTSEQSGAGIPDSVDQTSIAPEVMVPPEVSKQYSSLSISLAKLNLSIKKSLKASNEDLQDVQNILDYRCGLKPYAESEATWENVFHRVVKESSIFDDPHVLSVIVDTFLLDNQALSIQMRDFAKAVDTFKSSAKLGHLVDLLKQNQRSRRNNCQVIRLKLKEHWSRCTVKHFENAMIQLLGSLYGRLSCMLVNNGCCCISWIIADDVPASQLLPKHSKELFKIIGVIFLQIGEEMVYDSTGEVPGCEVLEAAMLQAIELKNTRAIELLLAVGCSSEVATCNGDHVVTNVVNIRERSVDDGSGGGVDHVCVLGHNEHIEAIIDPEPTCAACGIKEELIKQLRMQVERKDHTEIQELMKKLKGKDAELTKVTEQLKFKEKLADTLQSKNETLSSEYDAYQTKKAAEIEELTEQLKEKEKIADALQFKNETLSTEYYAKKEKLADALQCKNETLSTKYYAKKDAEIEELTEQLKEKTAESASLESKVKEKEEEEKKSLSASSCTAVLPRQSVLGIYAEMKVRVITRNNDGKQLTNGGSAVRASLTCNKEECPVTDNGDGTYLVSVVPQQLGQHHLSITVNGGHIKDSPFTLDIVPQRDYTQLMKEPSQTITGVSNPKHIAFSDNGDMFITSSDHCIYVYDKSGNRKATIGSEGTGKFQLPYGIDISNGVVYVAEHWGHRIRMLTTGGEFIHTFGEKGSGIGQFNGPNDVKISPDGRVYVADRYNNRVQVFNPDWTISHVIDSSSVPVGDMFSSPRAIAFDLSDNVHVGCTSSVIVFTPTRQFVRHYSGSECSFACGIVMDPSGYSLVTEWDNNTLSVYDPSGGLVHSIRGLRSPTGVSVSPDGSVWVADTYNNRLVKYNFV